MNTFFEAILESAALFAVILAMGGAIAALLTYIFRRMQREQDAMTTEVQELKADHIRVAERISGIADNWDAQARLQRQAFDVMDVSFGTLAIRLNTVNAQYAEMQGHQEDLRRVLDDMKGSHEGLQRAQEAMERNLAEVRRQYAGMQEDIAEMRAGLREIRDSIVVAD